MLKPVKDYAAPLVALDEVIRIDETGVTTRKQVKAIEPFFVGHYPNNPIYPGVFIVEAIQQAVKYYAAFYGRQIKLLEVRSTRFIAPVQPGDTLEITCQCTFQSDYQFLKVKAVCCTQNNQVAVAMLNFCIVQDDD